MHTINKSPSSGSQTIYDLFPDFCPVCHRSAEIILADSFPHFFPSEGSDAEKKMQLLFRCPRKHCGTKFLVEYEKTLNQARGNWYYAATKIYPNIHKEAAIADGIAEISPRFVKILQQASIADGQNLDEVSGIGYRKAIEFLIKDYCIQKSKGKEAAIRSSLLGKCITEFVSDANVKECARRAAWLGNDEAHYERVWTSHDIRDLKMLIQLTQNWISNELLTAKYLVELDKDKPAKKAE
jgi:hypothetical protein